MAVVEGKTAAAGKITVEGKTAIRMDKMALGTAKDTGVTQGEETDMAKVAGTDTAKARQARAPTSSRYDRSSLPDGAAPDRVACWSPALLLSRGSVNQNVAPDPGALSTPARPPCWVMMLRQI